MAVSVDRPLVSPTLVGRGRQLDALARLFEQCTSGRGQVVLLAGEAGVGKTRLAAEAKAHAAQHGFRVLEGTCFEADRAMPYALVLDVLRDIAGGPAETRAELERLVAAQPRQSGIRRLLSEALDLDDVDVDLFAKPDANADEDKRRLFHGLARLLTDLAHKQPLLVALDDLHWSDDNSLELLRYLAPRLTETPVILVLIYRDDEVQPTLAHTLADLGRRRLAVDMPVGRLSRADVAAMCESIFELRRPMRGEFLDVLHRLTEGNPFFVEEVLRSLVASGDVFFSTTSDGWERKALEDLRVPASVGDAVQRRAARLSQPTREILALAAVVGRRFDFGLLHALTGHTEDELLRFIKELVVYQLIVEETDERFAFRHALTRQAIYGELLARERRALHRRVAETLDQLARTHGDGDVYAADLGYHYAAGGIWDKALVHARRAGEHAAAVYAPRAAVEHLSRALQAMRELGLEPEFDALRLRALAYERQGEFDRALADLEAALTLAKASAAQREHWQTLLDLSGLWSGREYQRSGEFAQQALESARELGDPLLVARSLNGLGTWHMNMDAPWAAWQHFAEALEIFRATDDRPGVASTLDLLGMASNMGADPHAGTAFFEEAIVRFRELDDRHGLSSSLLGLAEQSVTLFYETVPFPTTSSAEAVTKAELALRLAREADWRAGEAYALGILGMCFIPSGEFGRALASLREGQAAAEEIEHREWMANAHMGLGALHLALLDVATAQSHFERMQALAEEIRSFIWVHMASASLAAAYVLAGDAASLDLAQHLLDANWPANRAPQLETLTGRVGWLVRAELALAQNTPAVALDIVERLIATASHRREHDVMPRLWLARGQALAALGQLAEAHADLRAAADAALAREHTSIAWRILAALGKLERGRGRRTDAEHAFGEARAIVETLAASVPDADARASFRARSVNILPRQPTPTPRRAAKANFGGLTARERQVAALVGGGLSNRDIADALVVTERTVEAHVGNILGKLGFNSRTQVATWAVDRGLRTQESTY